MVPLSSWILSEGYAGMQAQALGLAEAAGLAPELRVLKPRGIWRHLTPALWPAPLRAVEPAAVAPPLPDLLIACGSKAGVVLAALAGQARRCQAHRVMVQRPPVSPIRFDLVMVTRHDELTGPNVVVTRTALHRVTPARLAEAAALWAPRLAHLPRPLVVVLVGGSNGRFRLDAPVGARLAGALAEMMRRDHVGLALTPSRRTDPAVVRLLGETLRPLGAYVWDMQGENPYFGLLALADAIVATGDSVSMISEAVATAAPVLVAALPGRSRRIGLFTRGLFADGRTRPFRGRLETWPAEPLNDTPEAAAEMCRRLGLRPPG
jgi:mitochondrial fission protein ELM1